MTFREPIAAFQCLYMDHKKAGEELFIREYSERTKRNGFKVKENQFILDIRNSSHRGW